MPNLNLSISKKHTSTAVLLVPGYGPDVLPVRVLGEHLAQLGLSVTVTNFWGNRRPPDFANLSLEECVYDLASIIASLRASHERVVGIGVSLGGALLMEYAKTQRGLSSIVSIGTPLKLRYRWIYVAIVKTMPVFAPVWSIVARIKRLRIPPMRSAPAVMTYLEGPFLHGLENIHTTLLLLHSKKDVIADYRTVQQFARSFSKHHAVIFENGDHVLDYDVDRITECILAHEAGQ